MSQFHRQQGEGADKAADRATPTLILVPEWHGQGLSRAVDARSAEIAGLARAIALDVREVRAVKVRSPRPSTLFGTGQLDEIGAAIAMVEAELVVVDAALTAVQQRNLEKHWSVKVIDRTGLILEIFGERAATAEGRMQVELAHLDYQAGRLVRSWTHLERQRGGFGFLGGPGETQIEADRRMIRDRMARIRRQLEDVKRTRALQRAKRQRAPWPVIALVGYTNAGKSTLFNDLTHSTVMAEDLLFATLDPTMRSIRLPGIDKAILSDTVGFVSDLPTELVAAFRATLEEVLTADLILHVRDIAHPDTAEQRDDVLDILGALDIGPRAAARDDADDAVPIDVVEVWNKIDLLPPDDRAEMLASTADRPDVVAVSAEKGEGLDRLRAVIVDRLTATDADYDIHVAADAGDELAWLHAHGTVDGVQTEDDGTSVVTVRLSPRDRGRFAKRFGRDHVVTDPDEN